MKKLKVYLIRMSKGRFHELSHDWLWKTAEITTTSRGSKVESALLSPLPYHETWPDATGQIQLRSPGAALPDAPDTVHVPLDILTAHHEFRRPVVRLAREKQGAGQSL